MSCVTTKSDIDVMAGLLNSTIEIEASLGKMDIINLQTYTDFFKDLEDTL